MREKREERGERRKRAENSDLKTGGDKMWSGKKSFKTFTPVWI